MEQKTLLKNKKNQGNGGDYGNEGNQMSHSEQMIENQFIQILSEKENQWTYRPDLKSEEALWQNFRSHLNRINLAVLGEQPLTDKEFKQVKVEFSRLTGTPFLASQWLRGENGVAQILLEREDGKKVTLSFDFLQSAMNEYQSDKKTIPYLTHLLDSMTLSKEEFEAKTGEKYRRRTKVLEERLQQNFEQLQKWKEEL